MALLPAAIGAGGSILGSMIGGKNAKQSANDAANAQQQLTQNTINQVENYDNQQRAQQRGAIAGLLQGGNPFFAAAGGLRPTYLSPGADTAQFGGGATPPGTFSMAPPTPVPFGGQNPFSGAGSGGGLHIPVGLQPGAAQSPSETPPGQIVSTPTQPKMPPPGALAPAAMPMPGTPGYNPFNGLRLTPNHQMPQFAVGAR